jgi:hypothetical protein
MKKYIVAIITLAASLTLHASEEFKFDVGEDQDYRFHNAQFEKENLDKLSAPCPKIYLPVLCEDEEGYEEEFTNECIAINAGFEFNCTLADEFLR